MSLYVFQGLNELFYNYFEVEETDMNLVKTVHKFYKADDITWF